MGQVYMKIHRVRGEVIVAVCDAELLGRSFQEGLLRLDVSEEFYGGLLVPISIALEEVNRATIANLVGRDIVNAAVERGLVHEDAVIFIKGVPHAQIVRMM